MANTSFTYYLRVCPRCNELHKTKARTSKAICVKCKKIRNGDDLIEIQN